MIAKVKNSVASGYIVLVFCHHESAVSFEIQLAKLFRSLFDCLSAPTDLGMLASDCFRSLPCKDGKMLADDEEILLREFDPIPGQKLELVGGDGRLRGYHHCKSI